MVSMASKKVKTSKPRKTSRVRSTAKRVYSRGKSIMGGKIRWGEGLLSFIVGWKGDDILNPLTTIANPYMPNNVRNSLNDIGNPGGYGSTLAEAAGVNKLLGTVAMAKVAYDVVSKKRLDQNDLSVYIPYAVGTIFDPAKSSGTSQEAWS